jgi:hypothetical protein
MGKARRLRYYRGIGKLRARKTSVAVRELFTPIGKPA